MRVLWDHGEGTVAAVQEALASTEQPLAYTTIATLLSRLDRRGLVEHRVDGRTFVYKPTVSQKRISSSLVGELLGGFFGGRPSELVSYLLAHEEIDAAELSRIKAHLARHEGAGQKQPPRKK